ncbi:RING-like zinc finger protein, partial [Teratosphaeria destructans]
TLGCCAFLSPSLPLLVHLCHSLLLRAPATYHLGSLEHPRPRGYACVLGGKAHWHLLRPCKEHATVVEAHAASTTPSFTAHCTSLAREPSKSLPRLSCLHAMRGMERRTRRICLVLAICLATAMAQTITASSWSASANASQQGDNSVELSISTGNTMAPLAAVLALTTAARDHIPAPGVSGNAVLANYSNQLSLNAHDVAVISCDSAAYVGNIGVMDVFGTAASTNVSSIVLYSQSADFCDLQGYSGSFSWIYSMKSRNDTQKLLDGISSYTASAGAVYLTIAAADSATSTTSSSAAASSSANAHQQNPLGPSPTTAVAMVILYSITGLITALFLIIIITGAVRAHRHPERYGPRNVTGRPRQSRARGLARAMLDTIPIVKFGERQDEAKPTDVELADSHVHGEVHAVGGTVDSADGQQAQKAPATTSDTAPDSDTCEDVSEGHTPARDGGIAPVTPVVTSSTAAAQVEMETEGCSICTEDFQRGEDQRVLPCDHRFHPACIDPWLLNVSGTCPLCRIDLRPQETESSADGEANEEATEGETSGEGMAPPLDRRDRRTSLRGSLARSWISNIGNPARMTREERILALREYRGSSAAQAQRQSEAEEGAEVREAESRLRARLRNVFRVRTRRIGQEESVAPSGSEESAAPQSGTGDARQEGDPAGPAAS